MSEKGTLWHSDQKKIEVVTTYLILGSAVDTARVCDVPVGTIHRWKAEPWWKELVDQIQTEDSQALDSKLAKRIDKALSLVEDRMENGDFMFNKVSGEFVRRPVSLKDVWKVNKEMIDVRMLIRKEKPAQANQEAIADILKVLAKDFAEMAKAKLKDAAVPMEPKADGT